MILRVLCWWVSSPFPILDEEVIALSIWLPRELTSEIKVLREDLKLPGLFKSHSGEEIWDLDLM